MHKFVNQSCLIQYVGFTNIVVYCSDQNKIYVLENKTLQVVKSLTIRDLKFVSICHTNVAQLTIDKNSQISNNDPLMH